MNKVKNIDRELMMEEEDIEDNPKNNNQNNKNQKR
jgi:hypothetical protein